MSMNDLLAGALSHLDNAERAGKEEVIIAPISKQMKAIFTILKQEGYIKDFEVAEDKKGSQIKVKLSKSINKIGVIKPRFSVKLDNFEKFEKRYLPAKDFGKLIISTPQGMMTNTEALKKKVGGVLIAYIY